MMLKFLLIVFCLFVPPRFTLGSIIRTYWYCQPPAVCTDMDKCSRVTYHTSGLLTSLLSFSIKKVDYCGFNKVCCEPLLEETTETTTTSTITPQPLRIGRWTDDLINHKNFDLLPMDTCGVISNHFRITSGANTSPGEFPWMALIAYKTGESEESEDFKCAATLINEMYVMTAAHCIDNSTMLGVRLGEYNMMTRIDCDLNGQKCEPPVQDLLINKTIIHPEYDSSDFINDIALIRLATPANCTYENVAPICLPFGDLIEIPLDGQQLTVAGWGATEQGDKSTILRKVTVPVVPHQDCQKLYETFKPITNQQICAGADKGRDSCTGDSGGPLKRVDLINQIPKYVQYGIVSFGPTHCGINNRPGIYTDVRKYMSWILDNISPSD